jgi:hypothetical protein
MARSSLHLTPGERAMKGIFSHHARQSLLDPGLVSLLEELAAASSTPPAPKPILKRSPTH